MKYSRLLLASFAASIWAAGCDSEAINHTEESSCEADGTCESGEPGTEGGEPGTESGGQYENCTEACGAHEKQCRGGSGWNVR